MAYVKTLEVNNDLNKHNSVSQMTKVYYFFTGPNIVANEAYNNELNRNSKFLN